MSLELAGRVNGIAVVLLLGANERAECVGHLHQVLVIFKRLVVDLGFAKLIRRLPEVVFAEGVRPLERRRMLWMDSVLTVELVVSLVFLFAWRKAEGGGALHEGSLGQDVARLSHAVIWVH